MAAVVYLVSDLFFVAKIEETAARLDVRAERAPDAAAFASASEARLAIVDLRRPDAMDALDRIAQTGHEVTTVGFVDHENVAAMDAARARGCRTVLSKRKFASTLPELIAACRDSDG
jgi:hypothetical protein